MRSRLLITAVLVVCAAVARAQSSEYRVFVDGLACPFCAYGVEKQLLELEGVTGVETQIREGFVVVTVEEGASLSEEQARRAVREAGFTLNRFEQIGP